MKLYRVLNKIDNYISIYEDSLTEYYLHIREFALCHDDFSRAIKRHLRHDAYINYQKLELLKSLRKEFSNEKKDN